MSQLKSSRMKFDSWGGELEGLEKLLEKKHDKKNLHNFLAVNLNFIEISVTNLKIKYSKRKFRFSKYFQLQTSHKVNFTHQPHFRFICLFDILLSALLSHSVEQIVQSAWLSFAIGDHRNVPLIMTNGIHRLIDHQFTLSRHREIMIDTRLDVGCDCESCKLSFNLR